MEEYPESIIQDMEEDNQYEEDVKIFESKYDNEFIGLLNEINTRLPNFSKHDILKINSWINILTIPCDSIDMKKNRNLYGIKLINQMVNGKLEEPFIRHANGPNDLKWLSPIDIKAELTKKFYEEIDFEKIENYGLLQQKYFLNNHPDIANKIKNKQNFANSKDNINNMNMNEIAGSPNNNNFNNLNNLNLNYNYNDFDDNFNDIIIDNNNINNINNINEMPYINEEKNFIPEDNKIMYNPQIKNKKGNNNMNNNINNHYNINKKTAQFKETINKKNNYKNYNDKLKLINIIRDLEQKVIERDEIIEFQNKQIEQIRNRVSFIQRLQNNNNQNN